jgi:hypothetical protein
MTLIGMWLGVALAQPLMVRKVQVVTRRQVLTRAPVDSQGLPSVEPATLAPEERGDLEALSERFRQRARALGFGALVPGPERPGVPTGVPAWPVGVIAAQVARAGPLTTWTLTANALTTERVGRGCCAPCPCGPSGCAPCAVCEERGCRAVVRGVQLVVTSTVEARALRREVVLAQTVDAAEPPAAAPAVGRSGRRPAQARPAGRRPRAVARAGVRGVQQVRRGAAVLLGAGARLEGRPARAGGGLRRRDSRGGVRAAGRPLHEARGPRGSGAAGGGLRARGALTASAGRPGACRASRLEACRGGHPSGAQPTSWQLFS